MKKHINRQWQTYAITLIACVLVYLEYNKAPAFAARASIMDEGRFFIAMGKWAIRFLLISLSITPLYALTGWRFPIKLRKPAGLLAFGFAVIHMGTYINISVSSFSARYLFDLLTESRFIIYGTGAFIILTLLAITSFKRTTKLMGRYWKPLHRLVYIAGILMIIHSTRAAQHGKITSIVRQDDTAELEFYLAILVILLTLRVPLVRDSLRRILPFGPAPRKRTASARSAT